MPGGPLLPHCKIDRVRTSAHDAAGLADQEASWQYNYLPTLRVQLVLAHANSQQALALLAPATSCELRLLAYSYYNWPNLYPVYVHGEAYLAAQSGAKAAAEFQKILAHRGIVLNEPIGALAYPGLGRAYALSGDKKRARAAYHDLLAL